MSLKFNRETPMIIQCHSTWQLGKGACKGRCDYQYLVKRLSLNGIESIKYSLPYFFIV